MHEGVYAKPLPNHELWCRLVESGRRQRQGYVSEISIPCSLPSVVLKRISTACLSLRITGVGRVDHGGVQDTIDLQQPRLLVQLVLDPGAFGDLDQGRELLWGLVSDRIVLPGMRHLGSSFRRT